MARASKKKNGFSKLTPSQRKRFATMCVRAVRALNMAGGGRYKVVNSPSVLNRERASTETVGEDGILTAWQRGHMLDLARNGARNSSTLNAILKQFDLQAVGTVGGKATFVFEDNEAADKMRAAFARWTRDADFFDGLPLGTLLKLVLKTYILGGDMVLLFDDDMIEDSGRVVVYEPDEIGNIDDAALARIYGKGARQRLGRVRNANDRDIGVIVSRSERGQDQFDFTHCYCLKRDPNDTDLERLWIMPRNVFRVAQGRGISPLTAPISTILDLEDLVEYELQAAKKNSQTLAQVLDNEDQDTGEIGSAFGADADFSQMTDEDFRAAEEAEAEMAPVTVSLDQIKGAGVLYEALPPKKRLELLDTKHPNANMPEFIRWLAGRSAAPFGLGSVYATMKADASYTAFRGEQVMSQPAFEEAQKFLEGICDWILVRWSKWAARKGIIDLEALPDDWLHRVSWQWPKMREVNQVDEQNAIQLKLKNGTGSYLEIYGPDWREKLTQIGEEIEFCKAHGLPHPSLQTVSGGVINVEA